MMEEKDDFFDDIPQNGGTMSDENKNKPPMCGGGAPKAKRKGRLPLVIGALVLAAVCFTAGWLGYYYSIDSRMRTLMWLLDVLESRYYKEVDLDDVYADLYDAATPDIYSRFYTADEYAVLQAESAGTNADTGISVIKNTMQIYMVIGNSSADLAGLKSGMTIYAYGADETSMQTGEYTEFVSFVGAHAGAFVLECGYSEETTAFYTVKSTEYLASYCTYADSEGSYSFRGESSLDLTQTGDGMEGLDEETAYLRLTQFDGNADEEFAECLALMKERGRVNLVLDLRCNGGGYLTTLQSICAHLMKNAEGSTPIVARAKYRSGKESIYYAYGNDYDSYFSEDSKITVLADENTASASECLLGVLIDYATLDYSDIYLRDQGDGTAKTYGKGIMQSTYAAADGSAFRLTVAEIFWPSGKSIHGTGVTDGDGANVVTAPLLRGETDTFLAEVLSAVCGSGAL